MSEMRVRVHNVVEKRRLVIGLSSTPNVVAPVREVTSVVADVDRAARAKYMREWQANAKTRRMVARAMALAEPRRSPRLASKKR